MANVNSLSPIGFVRYYLPYDNVDTAPAKNTPEQSVVKSVMLLPNYDGSAVVATAHRLYCNDERVEMRLFVQGRRLDWGREMPDLEFYFDVVPFINLTDLVDTAEHLAGSFNGWPKVLVKIVQYDSTYLIPFEKHIVYDGIVRDGKT